jgi:hypothetical protein
MAEAKFFAVIVKGRERLDAVSQTRDEANSAAQAKALETGKVVFVLEAVGAFEVQPATVTAVTVT